jgi:1-acyl-sn-glycerol-3-phosphate acyltransferase
MQTFMATFVAYTFFGVTATVLTPIAFLLFLLRFIFPRRVKELAYAITRLWCKTLIALTQAKITVRGTENIPRDGSCCFVSNHCGLFDVVLMIAYVGRPFGFIAKKALSRFPIVNFYIPLMGGFFIDQVNPRRAAQTIAKGVAQLKNGAAMVIYPEGHRSRGKGLLPFKPGALKLATESKSAIVPVATSGSYEFFEKRYRVNSKIPLTLSFCPPIATAKGDLRRGELAELVQRIIQKELPDK